MMDADHFKAINDTYGHQTGDEVLRAISGPLPEVAAFERRVRALRRRGVRDRVPRDEPGGGGRRRRAAARRGRREPDPGRRQRAGVTVSIGLAGIRAGQDMDKLFQRADSALYTAKQDGRNLVRVTTRALPIDVARRAPAQPAPGRQAVRDARGRRPLAGRGAGAGLRGRQVGDRAAHARLQRRRVERACADGRILRTHVLRPTWHFVLPADIRWMLALTAPRVRAAMASYDRKLGSTDAVFAARAGRAGEGAGGRQAR